ncbi:FAD-dependent monooxygenase [Roseomonas sp. NAR14]|uniref:FAD-dependent monooxygenase n=1 Tax=Roseomonas acroporae TaxID=2937791 RepID=A0A9X2BUV4_9PROT|nr:FAD-dependent monooxygenase [Roseomonas acroporae]MCK8784496.1 FAD-dependent monooxygenase [Roseomonas acroporae]
MAVQDHVLVVGAGPVGAVMALTLCQRGFPVTLIEAEPGPVEDQRAATVHPPTVEMLAAMGLRDAAWETGLLSPLFHFRDRITGELVAEFDVGMLEGEVPYPFVLQWEQYKLVLAALDKAAGTGLLTTRFATRLLSFTQDTDHVHALVETEGGTETLTANWLIGADGGRSTVRKLAGIEFEGFTWPERFIKIGTTYDFLEAGKGYCTRNYFSDPDEWLNLFKVKGPGEPGIWRGIFPVPPEEPDEAALSHEGVQRRLQKFLPREGGYEIAYHALYKVHQRVAATFNLGRVLLAGDAAHVNNPIGGMGMNGGLHDAVNLAGKLESIRDGGAGMEALDRYTRQRRKAQTDFVQAQSVANKQSLSERDPAKRREHLDRLRRTAADPALHKAFLRRSSLIDSLDTANAVA